MKKYQKGVTLTGLLFWGAIFILIAALAMKISPSVIEYFKILNDVKSTVTRVGPDATVAEVRKAFDKFAEVDHLTDFKSSALDISKDGGRIVIEFDYERRIDLFRNVSLVINYRGSSAQ